MDCASAVKGSPMTKKSSSREEVERRIREAGERARAEAEARRAEQKTKHPARPKEFGGPTGPEPTRYGDWERKGIASDF